MSARQKVSDVEVVATDSPRDDVDEVVGHVAIARVPGHLINNIYILKFIIQFIMKFIFLILISRARSHCEGSGAPGFDAH